MGIADTEDHLGTAQFGELASLAIMKGVAEVLEGLRHVTYRLK
jgi:hypothetical protein